MNLSTLSSTGLNKLPVLQAQAQQPLAAKKLAPRNGYIARTAACLNPKRHVTHVEHVVAVHLQVKSRLSSRGHILCQDRGQAFQDFTPLL